jgi:spore coat polysaccharide biosynthesis protein SpsF (cytidylyltransferase family)
MDWQTLINIGAGSVLAVIGWFARELWEAVNAMKKDLHRLEVKLAKDYTTHQDMNARFDKLEGILERIFDKLDNKVDK